MALVPESVSRSIETSSDRSRKVFHPARSRAARRSGSGRKLIGSTILTFQGSAHDRFRVLMPVSGLNG
jgi:hypothetical protein